MWSISWDIQVKISLLSELIMKAIHRIIIVWILAGLLSSCGAIPTLPPLDATIMIRTPNFTVSPPQATGTKVNLVSTDDPSTPAPTKTEAVSSTKTLEPSPTKVKKTSTPTKKPDLTPTKTQPTSTPLATATPTPQPTQTPTPVPYQLQLMNPFYLANFTHPDLGCDWMGIAGQIFDKDGVVQKEILVKAGGEILGTQVVEELTMPLTDPDIDLAYGPGGYEITLAYSTADTVDTAWIQLFNLEGDPLSEKIYLTTYDDCLKNLILMNFSEQ
jgi:hypothetical protein